MFNLGGIFVSLKADKRQFDDTIDHAERRARTFASNWERMAMGMGKAFALKQVADVGIAAVNKAADSFITYEKRLVGLSKASDQTGDRLTFLRGRLELLATSMKGVALDDLVDIATEVAKMGTPTDQIVEMTRGIAMLSQAIDDMPASEVANNIGKINNVFGLGGKGALQLGSAIDRLADSGTSSASEIMRVMQYVSGTAKSMNISAQESLGFAAALLNTGVRAEESGTALKKLFGLLSQTDSSLAKPRTTILNLLGMNESSFQAARDRSPVAILIQLLEKLKTLSLDEQSDTLRNLGLGSASEAGPLQNLMGNLEGVKVGTQQAKDEFVSLAQIMKSTAADADRVGAAIQRAYNAQEVAINKMGKSASIAKLVANRWWGDILGGLSELNPLGGKVDLSVVATKPALPAPITPEMQAATEQMRRDSATAKAAEETKKRGEETIKKMTDLVTFLRTDPKVRLTAKDLLGIPRSLEEREKNFVGPPRPSADGMGAMSFALSAARNTIFAMGANAQGPLNRIRQEQIASLGQVFTGADLAAAAQKAAMEGVQQDRERELRVAEDSLEALREIRNSVSRWNGGDTSAVLK